MCEPAPGDSKPTRKATCPKRKSLKQPARRGHAKGGCVHTASPPQCLWGSWQPMGRFAQAPHPRPPTRKRQLEAPSPASFDNDTWTSFNSEASVWDTRRGIHCAQQETSFWWLHTCREFWEFSSLQITGSFSGVDTCPIPQKSSSSVNTQCVVVTRIRHQVLRNSGS